MVSPSPAPRRLRCLAQQLQRPAPLPASALEQQPLASPWSAPDGSILAAWEHGNKAVTPRGDRKKTFNVLGAADHAFFEREGYLLVRCARCRSLPRPPLSPAWLASQRGC